MGTEGQHRGLKLSADCRYQVARIGREQQPLLIIDNLIAQPQSLLQFALQQSDVLPAAGLYPGLRSATPASYASVLCQQLRPLLCEVFALPEYQIKRAECYFSLVCTPPEELSVAQQLAHFDQPKTDELAVVHYLCSDEHGGTSFYRHRSSGFEYVDNERHDNYLRTLQKEIQQYGMPGKPCYIKGENVFFERVASVAAKFNRAVIYRCSSLHSGDIPPDYRFDMDPLTGRFTVTSFIHA